MNDYEPKRSGSTSGDNIGNRRRYVVCNIHESGDIEISILGPKNTTNAHDRIERGKIRYLSARARARMLFTVRNSAVKFASMITLTWPKEYPRDGKEVKRQLHSFLVWSQRNVDNDYFWFLEFQTRGAPHIHVFTPAYPSTGLRDMVSIKWANITVLDNDSKDWEHVRWQHNKPAHFDLLRSDEGALRYVAKYALKTSQKVVPPDYADVGRFWGATKGVSRKTPWVREIIDERLLYDLLRVEGHRCGDWEHLPKHIFGTKFGQELVQSSRRRQKPRTKD